MNADRPAGEPGRSHHPLAGRPVAAEDAALRARRAAIAELGDALRELVGQASATAAQPGTVLVEAAGAFVALRPDQAARLFRGIRPDATDPLVAHD
jgi:hypothetical protein